MSRKISIICLLLILALSVNASLERQCSTLSCVHSSAAVIQRLNSQVNPCDDFYEYACGTFLEEQHTPDEKSTVDTISLMNEKLTEYLLTLLLKPSDGSEPKLHKLAKLLFNSCLDLSTHPSAPARDSKEFKKINFTRSSEQTRQRAGSESHQGDRSLANARG
jgi:predicted metalloendopeptidase